MNDVKVIISLTSHTEERLKNVGKYLYASVFKYKLNYVKVVLTLYKDDIKFIPSDLQTLIDLNYVELIVADKNLGPHLKYFYVMQKYRDLPIITIDDDSIYPEYMIPLYLSEHEKHKDNVICRAARLITFKNNKVCPFSEWKNRFPPPKEPCHKLHAEGFSGILYPPNCLKITDEMIPEILSVFRADDIYLSILEIRNGIKVRFLHEHRNDLILSTKGHNALSMMPDLWKKSNEYVKLFENEFIDD